MSLLNQRHNRARGSAQPDWATWGVLFLSMAAFGARLAQRPERETNRHRQRLVLFGLVLYQLYRLLVPLIEEGDKYLDPGDLHSVRLAIVKTMGLLAFSGFGATSRAIRHGRCKSPTSVPRIPISKDISSTIRRVISMRSGSRESSRALIGASGDTLRVIVESPSLSPTSSCASWCSHICGAPSTADSPSLAMLMVALNPALLFDTVVWGQSDSVLTLVMWLAVIATLEGEYEISWALAAVSVLIKPQG